MKVGDLVKYKDYPENGYGIVLRKDSQAGYDYILLYWHDADPNYDDYIWERENWLEPISESR